MNMTKTIVLEPSTNTHSMTGVIDVKPVDASILKIRTAGPSQVVHGEHHTIGIESENVIKYVQQELNPVTGKLQNAWD